MLALIITEGQINTNNLGVTLASWRHGKPNLVRSLRWNNVLLCNISKVHNIQSVAERANQAGLGICLTYRNVLINPTTSSKYSCQHCARSKYNTQIYESFCCLPGTI